MNIVVDTNTLVGIVTAALVVAAIKGIFNMNKWLSKLDGRVGKSEISIGYLAERGAAFETRISNFEGVCSQQHGRPVNLIQIKGKT